MLSLGRFFSSYKDEISSSEVCLDVEVNSKNLTRLEFYRVLSARMCDANSSTATAELLGYLKSMSTVFFFHPAGIKSD